MRKMRRFFAFLCCLCMVVGITFPATAERQEAVLAYAFEGQTEASDEMEIFEESSTYATEGDGSTVSRVEWLHELTQIFNMTVAKDNYPDNYYSDIDASSEYYYDVMLATEFGMVEVETGEQFRPDDPATREFAAHTLNFGLGYVLEEQDYTFSEAAQVTYADDIQIAINQGWFTLTDGAFLPEQAITGDEKTALLQVATDAMAATEVHPENSEYSLKDSVVVIPTEVEKEMISDTELAFYDLTEDLAEGDIFAVLDGGFPYVKKVVSVATSGTKTTVTVADVALTDAFDTFDVQGSVAADLAEVEAYNSEVHMSYIVGGTPEANFSDGVEYDSVEETLGMEISAVNAQVTYAIPESVQKEFNLAPGVKAVLTATISDVVVDHKSSLNSAQAQASATVTFTCNVSMDVLEAIGVSKSIELIKVPVAWGIYITLSLELSLKGEVTVALVEYVSAGFSFSNGSFRLLNNFYKKSFTVTAKAEASAGLKMSATLDLVAFKASLYAKAGVSATASVVIHGEGSPTRCTHVQAHLYAAIGASVKLNLLVYKNSWGKELPIFDKWNSPVRVSFHFEDGVAVHRCTRDSSLSATSQSGSGLYKYYTPITSQYGYNGANTGVGANGEIFTIFSYTEGENGITLTGYNGNVSALNIPSTLDGHTVVGLGDSLFKGNRSLRMVVVPDTVKNIENSVFKECTNLQSVILPEELDSLGNDAFYDCSSLQAIKIPNGLEVIGGHTFRNCKSLTEVVIPDSVTEIGEWAFAECIKLASVTLSKNLVNMHSNAFGNCDALTSIEIPKSLEIGGATYWGNEKGVFIDCDGLKEVTFEQGTTRIVECLFANCPGLETIEIPNTVTIIEAHAFYNCGNLKEVTISNSVTEIGGSAFAECIKLASVTLSKNLINMHSNAFGNCDALTSIEIPKSLEIGGATYWGDEKGVFRECDGLKEVTFEQGTTRIVECLFANCHGLEKIEIPNTVATIEAHAFFNCDNLKEVTLPNSVTEIGGSAFAECITLTDVILPKNLINMHSNAFGNCDALTKIQIPKSLKMGGSTYWGDEKGVFRDCDGLKEVTFEAGRTQLIECLFANCPGLEKIDIPDTIMIIEDCVFYNCVNLKEVTIPNSVTSIGGSAFQYCSSLKDIIIPDSVTEIGASAFYACAELSEITIPDSVTLLGESAFSNCTKLTKVVLSDNITEIKNDTFLSCVLLSEIEMGNGITQICSCAFQNCKALEIIEIPNSLKSISTYAFNDCDALISITLPESVTSLGSYCFYSCDSLAEIKFGAGITEIPSYAFDQCGSLTAIVLPRRLEKINNNAFTNNPLLLSITIPRSVTTISSTAFNYYDDITIYGVAGTYAETYAGTLGAKFVALEVPAESAELNKTELTLNRYESEILYLTITPDNFTDTVKWKSSDTNVVTISEDGKVYAVAAGTAVIRVSVGNKSASCTVTVLQPVTSISLNKSSLTMSTNDTYTLTANVYPSDAHDKTVVWSSSDETVATVSQDGLVTAAGKGTATITVKAQDGSNVSRSCTVTVNRCNNICTSSEEMESPHEYENNCTDSWTYTKSGAEYLKVTFAEETMIEDFFDYLYIYDGQKNQVGKYTGAELSGVTVTVPGDTVVIQFETDEEGGEWGFKVTEITSDLDEKEEPDNPDNPDDPNGGEGGNPTVPSDPIEAFVTHMYRIILEREPDAGSATWINGLKDGSMTGVRVADGFVLSEEMLNKDISNEEFVKILYRAFFGREADEGGLATWKNLLDAGCKKTYVFAGFANSTEFGNLCAEAGIVQGRAAEYLADRQTGLTEADYKVWCFVERMYMEVLNRTADEPGVRSWVGALQDGSMTGVQVADGFIMSEEFLAKNMTNEEYVRIMYRAFFGRDADSEGLATWTNALATGWTKQDIFAGFANSNEFGALCEQAGIVKGTAEEQ